ncbi:MAG: immunoglobulin domain-containing protein, partial [Bacteroidales bacterium]|nr:immunoglobulin domain-containing protein [Bacteroidales bacterium]
MKQIAIFIVLLNIYLFNNNLFGQGTNCNSATLINLNALTAEFTVNGDGDTDSPNLSGSGCVDSYLNENWFKFTANSTGFVYLTFQNSGDQSAYIYIYNGDCANLSYMICNQALTKSACLVNISISSGNVYYVRIIKSAPGTVMGKLGLYSNVGNNAVLCLPDKEQYWTGYNQNGKNDGPLYASCIGNGRHGGWAKFNTSQVPSYGNMEANSLAIKFFVTTQSSTLSNGCQIIDQLSDPVSGTASTYSCGSMFGGCSRSYTGGKISGFKPNTTYTYNLTQNAPNHFINTLNSNQGWFALDIVVDEASMWPTSQAARFMGWSDPYPPFIVVTYMISGCTTPIITTHPLSITECEDKAIKLTVAADGNPVPTYQWKKGANNIANATNTEFSISNIALTDAASYTCVVTNTCGSVTSNAAILTVNSKPVISFITPDKYKCLRDSVLIKVIVAGENLTYQWYKDGNIFNGRTDSQFILPGLTQINSGVYNCIVTNACGSTTSTNCTMSVSQPPEIKNSIENQTKCEDDSIKMIVETDAGDYKYQWILNDEPIEGATTTSYTVEKLAKKNEGVYSCSVKSNCEPIYLKPFVVTVIQKPIINIAPLIQIKDIGDSVAWFLSPGGTPPFEYQWLRNNEIIAGATEDFY